MIKQYFSNIILSKDKVAILNQLERAIQLITTPMQTVQIPAYGRNFDFEIPLAEKYTPVLEAETKTCVLVMENGDVYQPLETVL